MKLLMIILCFLILSGCASSPYKKEKNTIDAAIDAFGKCKDDGKLDKYICAQNLYLGIDKVNDKFPLKAVFLEFSDKLHEVYFLRYQNKINDKQEEFEVSKIKNIFFENAKKIAMQIDSIGISPGYTPSEALRDFSSDYSKRMQQNPSRPIFCNPTGSGSFVCN
ncbi:hypothetical protein [Limnohabitans sp.]|uniref:hypothetical protein n=1 Tax=Limnohabitans sp. TaxID=1907725 RepID=UPI0038BB4535